MKWEVGKTLEEYSWVLMNLINYILGIQILIIYILMLVSETNWDYPILNFHLHTK